MPLVASFVSLFGLGITDEKKAGVYGAILLTVKIKVLTALRQVDSPQGLEAGTNLVTAGVCFHVSAAQ